MPESTPQPPNILLITNDEHRFDFFEGGPVPDLRTPHLSSLQREGTTFSHGYSTCPLCVPTRFSWTYGLRASQGNGAWGESDPCWPTHLNSMPRALQGAGYHTALVGKLHSHNGTDPLDLLDCVEETRSRGYHDVHEVAGKSMVLYHDCHYTRHLEKHGILDAYRDNLRGADGVMAPHPFPFEAEHAMDSFIGRATRAWLENHDQPKPFFLHASFCNPHFPFDPPEPYASRHRPEDMPNPVLVEDADQRKKFRRLAALYCGLIEHCDTEIGKLLQVLEDRGLRNNTLVIFCSDHGENLGDRGLLGKQQPYEVSARTPVTLRLPGVIPAGRVLPDPVESIDLPATILEAAGLRASPRSILPASPARSFWQRATGVRESAPARTFAYSESGRWKMVCDGHWKLIRRHGEGLELYDLDHDPREVHNLANLADHRERVQRMTVWMVDAMAENIAPPTLNPYNQAHE